MLVLRYASLRGMSARGELIFRLELSDKHWQFTERALESPPGKRRRAESLCEYRSWSDAAPIDRHVYSLQPPVSQRVWLVCAEAGLCNKLRVVLSYRQAVPTGRLLVWWRRGAGCNCSFEDLFQPLPGVTFVSSCPPGCKLVTRHDPAYGASDDVADGLQLVRACYDSHPSVKYSLLEQAMYRQLQLRPELEARVAHNLAKLGGAGAFVAVHVRRTDHVEVFGEPGPAGSDDAFMRFVDSRPESEPIFVATDNPATQAMFVARYGARVRQLTLMADQAALGGDGCDGAGRHTSVAEAVVDLYTCVRASCFKGTPLSSFSDTVELLRRADGRSDGDEHVVKSLGGKVYDDRDYSVEIGLVEAMLAIAES